jgi:hypothetical protein
VPERVSDAPITEELKRIGTDVHYPDVCDCDLVGMQDQCSIQPRLESVGDWIKRLIAIIARLEAEKLAAHTEGWNAAIEDAARAAERIGLYGVEGKVVDAKRRCDGGSAERMAIWIAEGIRRLSKPTAAKPEPSASANRAEG